MLIDNQNIFLGVDTDKLVNLKDRYDTCHFSESGQVKTAEAFADSIRAVKTHPIASTFQKFHAEVVALPSPRRLKVASPTAANPKRKNTVVATSAGSFFGATSSGRVNSCKGRKVSGTPSC